jgi:hypothetical protein
MAQPSASYFSTLTDLVQPFLEKVNVQRLDLNPTRALWEVQGNKGHFDIRLKEIFSSTGRMYSYYVLVQGQVLVGFDNYPDKRALQQKYGQDYQQHSSELVPHRHGHLKVSLELTKEMTVEDFLAYVKETLIREE